MSPTVQAAVVLIMATPPSSKKRATWQLRGPRWVQNNPTGCGNDFYTRQTPFSEHSSIPDYLKIVHQNITLHKMGRLESTKKVEE